MFGDNLLCTQNDDFLSLLHILDHNIDNLMPLNFLPLFNHSKPILVSLLNTCHIFSGKLDTLIYC